MFEPLEVLARAGPRVVTPDDSTDVDGVKVVAVDNRCWGHRSAAGRAPRYEVVCLRARLEGDIPNRVRTDGENRLRPGIAAHHVDQVVSDNGGRGDEVRRGGERPELLAGSRIIGSNAGAAVGNDLHWPKPLVDGGRGTGGPRVLVAVHAPAFTAVIQIERRDEADRL